MRYVSVFLPSFSEVILRSEANSVISYQTVVRFFPSAIFHLFALVFNGFVHLSFLFPLFEKHLVSVFVIQDNKERNKLGSITVPG